MGNSKYTLKVQAFFRKAKTFSGTMLGGILCLIYIEAYAVECKGNGDSLGEGRVFFPNPVAYLQDQTLTDQNDADYAALQPAYQVVPLTNLDGSGLLRGDFAEVRTSVGKLACSADNQFIYNRSDDRFEQVMAYYWVTEAQKYVQSLGFGTTKRAIFNEPQKIRINQWGVDNSSINNNRIMTLGKGAVDDAEDAEVILHEYGHVLLDIQAPDPGGYWPAYKKILEWGAIHEAFADYFAVTVSDVIAPTADPACVADWDSTSYTSTVPHCLRRIDLDLHYPEDVVAGNLHRTGRIWSRALFDIRNELGHVAADTIILEAQFSFVAGMNFFQAATVTVQTADALYGPLVAQIVRKAFEDRGIL